MKKKKLKKIENYFTMFSENDYVDQFQISEKCKKYFHKEEDFFQIIVFSDDNSVYQLADAETFGVELKTFNDLKVRFKSLTGEKINNVIESKINTDAEIL
jgi:hypothetical protein